MSQNCLRTPVGPVSVILPSIDLIEYCALKKCIPIFHSYKAVMELKRGKNSPKNDEIPAKLIKQAYFFMFLFLLEGPSPRGMCINSVLFSTVQYLSLSEVSRPMLLVELLNE